MSEYNPKSFYVQTRNNLLDSIQTSYTQKRVEMGTAHEVSTSAIVFSNLKENGFIKGLPKSAREIKYFYDETIKNAPINEEDKIPMSDVLVWVYMTAGAAQIMLTIAGYKHIDDAGHWERFLPYSGNDEE